MARTLKMVVNKKSLSSHDVSLKKLTILAHQIATSDGEAIMARWAFGHELLRARVNYKGRLTLSQELKTRLVEDFGISEREILHRRRCAEKYSTKQLMCNAVTQYKTWHRLVHEGLVDKPRTKSTKDKSKKAVFSAASLRGVSKQMRDALTQHLTLNRDQVRAIEDLFGTLKQIIDQIDRNDEARAS